MSLPRILRTFLLFFFFLSIILLPQKSFAQQSYNVNPEVTEGQVRFLQLSAGFACQLTGINIFSPEHDCKGNLIAQGERSLGLIGVASDLIGATYTQPASTGKYISTLSEDFGLTKKAYAQQSAGFDALAQVQEMWSAIRNLTFVILVAFFILIGFGIMLRFQIAPKTAMTVQNQLPKIVVAIILISFSYAIAGLLVDAMWFSTYTSINVLTNPENGLDQCGGDDPSGGSGNANRTTTSVVTQGLLNNPIGYTTELFGDEGGCFGSLDGISGLAKDLGFTVGDIVSRTAIEAMGLDTDNGDNCDTGWRSLGGVLDVKDCVEDGLFKFIKYLIGIIAVMIFFFAIVFALFRLWFTLIRAYIYVILGTVFAPVWILMGLLPNSSMGFTKWLRFMIAHLLVFPTAALIIIAARTFAVTDSVNNTVDGQFYPPLLGNPNISDNIGILIAFGFLMIGPELLNMVRDAVKSPPNKTISGAIQGGFGAGVGAGMAGPRFAWKRAMQPWDAHKQDAGFLRKRLIGVGNSSPARWQRYMKAVIGGAPKEHLSGSSSSNSGGSTGHGP
jgi:hypothetical protein